MFSSPPEFCKLSEAQADPFFGFVAVVFVCFPLTDLTAFVILYLQEQAQFSSGHFLLAMFFGLFT